MAVVKYKMFTVVTVIYMFKHLKSQQDKGVAYSRYLVHSGGSDIAMKVQFVKIVHMMNKLNKVNKLRK